MKVNLVAQALSDSVADALKFCLKELQLSDFQGCEKTIAFIRLINRLFVILNSRNPLGKGYKAALTQKNENYWHPFMADAVTYLSKVTNTDGKLLHNTKGRPLLLASSLPL